MLDAFTWYKQSTFRWKGEKLVVYIDSWGLTDDALPPADLLLITHAHGDHYAPDDIARVKKSKTVVVAPADVAKELSGNIKPVKPGERNNWVGYVLELGGNTYYHAGDTDHLPELNRIRSDVAFLPIGDGGYVMTVSEAAGMAKALRPKIAVPMHYGFYPGVGVPADGERFKKAAAPVEVKVFTPVHPFANK
jgi:L-ascorbate metabolism protein UlaG (beta-lactamase superfamily)